MGWMVWPPTVKGGCSAPVAQALTLTQEISAATVRGAGAAGEVAAIGTSDAIAQPATPIML
ncbi:hypothetical protein GCM10010994_38460 [Chelatococcus reniformis]|uniref:Uncharacterized protein n=1 Tax=Chelatococcus reniformis TaxID=1494448 RepID=A0A916ULT8_9HYPH|nr:hypothetical protein GCM10010994_38460 [Chelatococcus reniformis]